MSLFVGNLSLSQKLFPASFFVVQKYRCAGSVGHSIQDPVKVFFVASSVQHSCLSIKMRRCGQLGLLIGLMTP
jgi:hypothetical protein